MGLFDTHIIPPSAGHLVLLRLLLVMTYAFFLPYLGMVVGATFLSVTFNARDRDIPNHTFARMAKDLMDMVIPNRWAALILGVIPLLLLWMIYGEWLAKSSPSSFYLLPIGAVIVAVSFGPILSYRATLYRDGRNSLVNFGLGGAGLATLMLGSYLLVGAITRFNDPERWPLDHTVLRQLLSFNIIWRYAVFFIGGVAFTGVGLLFFYFTWSGKKPLDDEKYATFMRNFGAGLALGTTALLPVMLFFWVVTTPFVAISGTIFGVAIVIVVVLFVAFMLLYHTITGQRVRHGSLVFILFLMFFLLTGFNDQLTLVNATQEHSAALVAEAEEIKAQEEIEREADRASAIVVDMGRGKEVFETVCMTCHRLDERLVGPPLNTVLPKYHGRYDDLVAFVQKPSKKNPDYPPMPAPGIPLGDIKSVAAYLLDLTGDSSVPAGEESGHDSGH